MYTLEKLTRVYQQMCTGVFTPTQVLMAERNVEITQMFFNKEWKIKLRYVGIKICSIVALKLNEYSLYIGRFQCRQASFTMISVKK